MPGSSVKIVMILHLVHVPELNIANRASEWILQRIQLQVVLVDQVRVRAVVLEVVVEEVAQYLESKAAELVKRGHSKDKIIIDPGIGFGKNHQHNIALMRAISRFKASGYDLLWGISRKSVIGQLTGKSTAKERLAGTLGSSIFAALNGVDILRVHDVDEHNDMLNVYQALVG